LLNPVAVAYPPTFSTWLLAVPSH